MKVTIFGSGYVGLVTGACLAQVGNQVLCVDIDERQDRPSSTTANVPIFEPGLEDMVRDNRAPAGCASRTDLAAGVAHGMFQFIAVGTPPDEDGSADLQHVLAVARSIGEHMVGAPDHRRQIHRACRHRRPRCAGHCEKP